MPWRHAWGERLHFRTSGRDSDQNTLAVNRFRCPPRSSTRPASVSARRRPGALLPDDRTRDRRREGCRRRHIGWCSPPREVMTTYAAINTHAARCGSARRPQRTPRPTFRLLPPCLAVGLAKRLDEPGFPRPPGSARLSRRRLQDRAPLAGAGWDRSDGFERIRTVRRHRRACALDDLESSKVSR